MGLLIVQWSSLVKVGGILLQFSPIFIDYLYYCLPKHNFERFCGKDVMEVKIKILENWSAFN